MRFSIVTPSYNMDRWIAETIESVLAQEGEFEIEYIVIDDGSTDRSASIANEYAGKIHEYTRCKHISMQVISQENTGMYEAINRGFARATGDVYAWINADDTFAPGAFAAVAKVFAKFPDIEWLKGISNAMDTNWQQLTVGQCNMYRQDWLRMGVYGQESYFVQQDAVFWRAELWKKVAPMPKHYRSAADYWLWIEMAKHAPLWSLNLHVSNFMKREGQISKGISKYKQEQWDARPRRPLGAWLPRLFFSPQSRLRGIGDAFFMALYPLLFMNGTEEYIEIESGVPIKKNARSFRC